MIAFQKGDIMSSEEEIKKLEKELEDIISGGRTPRKRLPYEDFFGEGVFDDEPWVKDSAGNCSPPPGSKTGHYKITSSGKLEPVKDPKNRNRSKKGS